MHSSLSPHLHKECTEIIKAFEQCHQDYPIGKFLGQCNRLKDQLTKCFAAESKERRRINREKGTAAQKKFNEHYKKYLEDEG